MLAGVGVDEREPEDRPHQGDPEDGVEAGLPTNTFKRIRVLKNREHRLKQLTNACTRVSTKSILSFEDYSDH